MTALDLPTFPFAACPPSAVVDLLRLSAGCTSAVRTRLVIEDRLGDVVGWVDRQGLEYAIDADGYLAIARDDHCAAGVLEVDARPWPHEDELGALLGYPRCCRAAVAALGEAAIDAREGDVARWRYRGRFWMLDTSRYRDGVALLSHLPCCAECVPSLGQARTVLAHVPMLRDAPQRRRLEQWAAARSSAPGGDIEADALEPRRQPGHRLVPHLGGEETGRERAADVDDPVGNAGVAEGAGERVDP